MAYSGSRGTSPYTEEDAQTVEKAKRIHKETTASAQRALKTANRTKELAANTLEELQRQGDKLEVIDQDLHAIDADVHESKGLLSYMQRCCLCFLCSCCCDCDPTVKEDQQRKNRVKQRKSERAEFREMVKENRKATNGVAADRREPMDEEEARGALFESKADAQRNKQSKRDKNSAYNIGQGLAEPDRQEILKETEVQEKTLDAIGDALDDMTRMGRAMHEELGRQEDVVARVTDHTDRTLVGLDGVQQSAQKTLGKKGTRQVQRKYIPSQTQVASHIASASRHF